MRHGPYGAVGPALQVHLLLLFRAVTNEVQKAQDRLDQVLVVRASDQQGDGQHARSRVCQLCGGCRFVEGLALQPERAHVAPGRVSQLEFDRSLLFGGLAQRIEDRRQGIDAPAAPADALGILSR